MDSSVQLQPRHERPHSDVGHVSMRGGGGGRFSSSARGWGNHWDPSLNRRVHPKVKHTYPSSSLLSCPSTLIGCCEWVRDVRLVLVQRTNETKIHSRLRRSSWLIILLLFIIEADEWNSAGRMYVWRWKLNEARPEPSVGETWCQTAMWSVVPGSCQAARL